ncbi:MAG: type IV pilus twitching motility protein PilT [Calditrichaeota bacterium]|nr:type IV pilus twitching motility protein PilT [Calditrichota bacterium]
MTQTPSAAAPATSAESAPKKPVYDLTELLTLMIGRGASDLHLTVGTSPQIRIDGDLVALEYPRLSPDDTKELAYGVLTETQRAEFEKQSELDLSFGIKGLSRFRANVYKQRDCVALALRAIPFEIRTFEKLGLPPVVEELADRPNGLCLVTGATGSGKSTTMAAMIDKINKEKPLHILTIEDPIEFIHQHRKSIVNQRQIHSDTVSFQRALKSVLRQDPDVVLIGEMRDKETIEIALTVAETGHLVFGTLHTNSAAQTINRIIDVFPPDQQDQVRTQLALVLQGVICQQLLPKIGGGRVMCCEIMVANSAIRAAIREGKVHQMDSMIQVGGKFGMMTMNQSLLRALQAGTVTREEAISRSNDPIDLESMIKRQMGAAAMSSNYGENEN